MARTYYSGDRSPEQIEEEIEQTRRRIGRTIDALQYRVTPGQLMDQAYGYLRDGPSEFFNNFGAALKNNPVPLALVGIGLTWLAMGGGRTPSYLRGSRSRYLEDESDEGTGTELREAAESTRGYLGSARRYVSDTATSAGGAASGASARVREMADDARDLAAEWGESATGFAQETRERMQHAGQTAQMQAMQLRESANDIMREQPLIAGALGVAIGAVLGALMPITRRENELMGQSRDRLVGQAKAAGESAIGEAKDMAKKVADATADAARGEAEKHGLAAHPPSAGGPGSS